MRAICGLSGWFAAVVLLRPGWAAAWLLLAPLVLVDWALDEHAARRGNTAWPWTWRAARRLQPWAAGLLIVASALPQGWLAAAVTLPWLLVTLLVAASVLPGLDRRAWRSTDRLASNAALAMIAIGGGFTVVDRLGWRPLDFEAVIVQLTAVHFHYAGFLLPLAVAWAAQDHPGRTTTACVAGVVAGVPMLAAGITLWPLLEFAAAMLLVASALLLGGAHVGRALSTPSAGQRTLWLLSAAALTAAMALAGAYAWGKFRGSGGPDIPQMLPTHGTLNAAGFALATLLAHRLERYGRSAAAAGNTSTPVRRSTPPRPARTA